MMGLLKWQKWALGVAVACVAIVGILAIAFSPIAASIIVHGARAAGFDLSYDSLAVHLDELHAKNLVIRTTGGEPVAQIASFDMQYSLTDALTGARQYGLRSFDVQHPRITLIRHRDGSWNIPIPKQQAGAPSTTPMIFDGEIREGSVDVYDRAQGTPAARHLMIRDIKASMNVATNAWTTYYADLAYEEAGNRYPMRGTGDINVRAGYGMQRWTAAQLPIANIVDVAMNSPSFHVIGGSLRNLDARVVALVNRDGALDQHIDATASLDRARLAIGGLRKPLRDVHGDLAVYGDGLLLESLNATIAGVPVRIGGGVFHLTDPNFRLTVAGRGDFHDLRTVLAQSSALPIAGATRLNVLIEGHPSKPFILIGVDAPRVNYAKATVDRTSALIAFDGQEADIVHFQTRYLGVTLGARGKVTLHRGPRALEMVAGVAAPPNAIPYASALLPGLPLRASVLATSDTLRTVDARGIVNGRSPSSSVAGIFDLSGNGVGTVGPLRITRTGNASLYAVAFVDRPHQRIDALVDASHFRVTLPQMAATVDGRIAGSFNHGTISTGGWTELQSVHTQYVDIARANARFGETPQHGLALAIDASGIGTLGAVATAMLNYKNGVVQVRDATASTGGTFVDAHGAIAGVTHSAPHYTVRARMHSADLTSLVAMAQPRSARFIEGSGEANLTVSGAGKNPALDGTIHAPEGAVNGLPFHEFDAAVSGTPSSLAISNGSVGVGTTNVGFNGAFAQSGERLQIRAPRADLEDFNDFFDRGDMLGGTGRIAADASIHGKAIATDGDVALHSARIRNFDVGAATARWHTRGERIDTALAFGGPSGTVHAQGGFIPNGMITGMTIHARNVDVGNWLAMGGYAMPISGIADADATVAGRFPALTASLNAHARNASVQHIPVTGLDVSATLNGTRGTLHGLTLRVPNASVTGSGTFGLRAGDPLALAFNGNTPDIGALAHTLTGKSVDAGGAVATTLRVSGTRLQPRIDDRFAASQLRLRKFVAPHAAGEVRADSRTVALTNTEVDLNRGRLHFSGTLPVNLASRQIDRRNRPITADLIADDIEMSNFISLLPHGTQLSGRLDGHVSAHGTVYSPRFAGTLTFAKGFYSSPQESVPIKDIGAQLAFAGTSATLQRAHATVGGGSVDADGHASIPEIRNPSRVSMQFNARAQHAYIDAPAYVKGHFDGDLHVTKNPGTPPLVAGTIVTESARIPLTALYNPKPANAPAVKPPDVALHLHIVAGRDVRVQSPNVDVGAEGFVDVGGSLPAPTLAGAFISTGGSISFYRTFQIQSGRVSFDASSGIIPYVNAVATTHVDDPPTDIALHVTGPATGLNIAFASSPMYDRAQILGLLVNAQALGAVQGVASTGQSSGFSATGAATQLAQGQLNQLFTRTVLEPFNVAAGGALGLSNLQITSSLQSGLGVNAVKAFGKTINLVYADTFNLPRRQSITLQAHPAPATQYSLAFYSTQGENILALQEPMALNALQPGFGNAAALSMDTGTNGVSFKVQRKFPRKFP